jgi:hypothetical protein
MRTFPGRKHHPFGGTTQQEIVSSMRAISPEPVWTALRPQLER